MMLKSVFENYPLERIIEKFLNDREFLRGNRFATLKFYRDNPSCGKAMAKHDILQQKSSPKGMWREITMKQRISAGAMILKDEEILLVHHQKAGCFDFWVPPGGGLKKDEGIFKGVEREVFEETNLKVKPDKIVYIEELIDENTYVCKIWVLCPIMGGTIDLCNLDADENHVQGVKFFSREEIQNLKVYPELIKTTLWEDYREGFPIIKYIGFHR